MGYDMIHTNAHIYTSEKLRDITDLGWGELKDYVSPCLTSQEGICQVKGRLAYSNFLDLRIHYYIRAESGDGKRIKIIWIGQTLLTKWGINMQILETQALKNLIKDRYTIQPIDDILNLTTLLTICCRKIEQERRIPFDITADPDPFYSESNISYLKKKLDALEAGTLPLEEHELIEVD